MTKVYDFADLDTSKGPSLVAEIAQDPADITAALRLRYDVFVTELGAGGALVDHDACQEKDRFDSLADHLVLRDPCRPKGQQVVGTYRLISQTAANALGGFYSDAEFDLSPLRQSGLRLLELGRSCLHPDYRGGTALAVMWQALAQYVTRHSIDVLFGVASFPGTEENTLRQPISLLHHRHLAPKHLRVRSLQPQSAPQLPANMIDRIAARRQTPSLIKSYLKLGGVVGEGVFVDHMFNTTDICLILDTADLKSAVKP